MIPASSLTFGRGSLASKITTFSPLSLLDHSPGVSTRVHVIARGEQHDKEELNLFNRFPNKSSCIAYLVDKGRDESDSPTR
jgi:hypothetical protein